MMILLLPFFLGCQFFDSIYEGVGETGGDPNEYWCDANGVCLLASPNSALVQTAIDQGLFVPHSLGFCEEPKETWFTLQRLVPLKDDRYSLEAACCEDMGCEGIGKQTNVFPICLPDTQAWGVEGLIGAVSLDYDNWDKPLCENLDPYAFTLDYKYPMMCNKGVSCLGWMDECGCICDESYDCSLMQESIESLDPFLEEGQLIDWGWESACTGYPWEWDNWAYGVGAFLGTTCEWNQEVPEPGDVPNPLNDLMDSISCYNHTCDIPNLIIEELLIAPSYLTTTSNISFEENSIVFEECNHICSALGLSKRDQVIAISNDHRSPLQNDSWSLAFEEFMTDGFTEAVILDNSGREFTLVLNKK